MSYFRLTCQTTNISIEIPRGESQLIEWSGNRLPNQLRYVCPLCDCVELRDIAEDRTSDLIKAKGVNVVRLNQPSYDTTNDPFLTEDELIDFHEGIQKIAGPEEIEEFRSH